MIKKISILSVMTLFLISNVTVYPTFAQTNDEKLEFASYLEETLGHFWALEQNLDNNNTQLAIPHALHPIAELYDLMSPEIQKHDVALDSELRQTLLELKDKTTSNVSREQAQEAIDDAKDVIQIVRATVVGDESDKLDFKIKLIKKLLETSEIEYAEAVSNGEIKEMVEFQDGSAFVWRSQQIYDTIKSEIPEHEAGEIVEFYDDLLDAYDAKATPETNKTIINGLIHEFNVVLGEESEEKDLTDFVANVRTLLTEAKDEYAKGETDEALSLATKAYLDNFEYLESTVGAQKPDLNEEIEKMMRVELRDMIKNGAPESEVSAQIDKILLKMDEVAVIVPEFGPMAFLVLSVAIITVLIVGIKQQKLIPKL